MSKKPDKISKRGRVNEGRPSKYDPSILPLVKKLCEVGCTNLQLSVALGIAPHTIDNWKLEYPEFLRTIKEAKTDANGAVRRALWERAIGYEHPDLHISNHNGLITKTEIIKHYPPDTAAAFIWLKNRGALDPDTGEEEVWKDKQEVDHTHKVETIKITVVDPKKE